MKILRVLLVLAVIAYAGWLAWPLVSPFLEGAGPDTAAMRAGAEAQAGGLPVAALWIGTVLLYLIAALMLGSGNPRAAVAYFLGFVADAVLRLALDRGGETEVAARTTEMAPAAAGIDPTWIVLGALLVVGLLVVLVSRRRRAARTPGHLAP